MDLDPSELRRIASSYRLSQLIYACASLGIPDVLDTGPRSNVEVAAVLGLDPELVGRLLRAAASEGVVAFSDGMYAINEFSRQLCSTGDSMRDFVLGWSVFRPGYVGFAHLDDAVRTAKSGVELAYGEPFHSYLRTHRDEAARYEAAMESTVDGFRAAAAAYDFARFGTVVDVGGGQGAFLVAIIERTPKTRGVLFDLPDVVASAPWRLSPYPEADAISIVGGDMFDDVPAGGDAYVFSTVLRCFDDDECVKVLTVCAERMAADGRILALEMVMPDGIPPSPRGLADLQALVVYGGKDRTQAEWTELFARAGYATPSFHPSDHPYAIVEAALA